MSLRFVLLNKFFIQWDYLSDTLCMKWNEKDRNYSLTLTLFFFLFFPKIIHLSTTKGHKCCWTSWKTSLEVQKDILKSTNFGERQSLVEKREVLKTAMLFLPTVSGQCGSDTHSQGRHWPLDLAESQLCKCWMTLFRFSRTLLIAFHKCQRLFRFVLTHSLEPLGNLSLLISYH